MYIRTNSTLIVFVAGFLVMACSFLSGAQQPVSTAGGAVSAAIPDAPMPQIELAFVDDPQPGQTQNTQPAANSPSQDTSGQSSSTQQPATGNTAAPAPSNGPAQSSSSSQAQPSAAQQNQKETGAQEVKEEEHQRVLGIVPNFNETYHHNAAPLTAGEKINLAFHSSIDPFTFAAGFMVAGYHEALDDDPGFGWGPEGYFKRSGAAYLDAVDGTMIGNGFLPAILHQDPRYFRLGPGPTTKHRILYAVMTNFVCKGDNGHWQPNVSNVGGNIIAGALSNYYYPAQNSGWGQTITNGMIVTTEGAFGSLFDEFWPDISRKFLHKDPTHGLDAQQEAAGRSESDSGPGSGANSGSDKPIQK